MAKQAKEREPNITDTNVRSMTKRVLECHEEINTSKATHMNRCRRIRERMADVYETAAHQGIPQKIAKLHVKELRLIEDLRSVRSELDAEEQAFARKLAKAQSNKVQLSLWNEMPVLKAAKKSNGKKGATEGDDGEHEQEQEQQPVADPPPPDNEPGAEELGAVH